MCEPKGVGMASPSVFISFSERDNSTIRELFAGLGIQRVDFWDYSDAGQELHPGESLQPALAARIDSSDYFVAIISANSINRTLSNAPFFEVRYAIDSGKANDRVIPLVLDDPPAEWKTLYSELVDRVWLVVSTANDGYTEDAVRRICERLKVPYTPPALLNPEVFFAKYFLKEIGSKRLKRAAFVQLKRYMNTAGNEYLADKKPEKLWVGIKESIISFFGGLDHVAAGEKFFYPQVVRGVAELQLGELENAEQTFRSVTAGSDVDNEWLGLAYAGIGHAYFISQRYDDSVKAFEQAVKLLPDEKSLAVNYLAALAYSGSPVLYDPTVESMKDPSLTTADRQQLLTIRGVISYKQGDFAGTIAAFSSMRLSDLNETSAIYYAFALADRGFDSHAIEVLENAASRIDSHNLSHHLAHAYLRVGDISAALRVYESKILPLTSPPEFVRQVLVEYAQLIRSIEGLQSKKFREACERAVSFSLLPPPQSKADCFFTGFAFYLLGQNELARYHFQNSSGISNEYYDRLELKPFTVGAPGA